MIPVFRDSRPSGRLFQKAEVYRMAADAFEEPRRRMAKRMAESLSRRGRLLEKKEARR